MSYDGFDCMVLGCWFCCNDSFSAVLFWFFFFKQKTAYEMRISDWSSDVCSSDLTQIFFNGEVLEDSALVVIGASSRQMEVFKFEHFRPTDQKIVVTAADPERRVVWSLNAEPAAEEYARLIGVAAGDPIGRAHV